jgi:hypothetical protein
MKKLFKTNSALIGIYALLSFPLFYFVYKYGSPYLGMIDFFDYYKLYDKMDFKGASSPLNMRLVSSFCVYCLSKTGFYYNTACQVDGAPFSKVVYFNAVFFNFMCVVCTCVMLFHLAKKNGNSVLMSCVAGLLYILGFGTVFFELMPLTDAFSVLLFTIILFYNSKKSYLVFIPLIVLILQREYVLMAFGLMAFLDYFKYRNKYDLYTLLVSILCFAAYIILRKAIFETPRYAYHTSPEFMLGSLSTLHFPILPFIRQTFMTLNIVCIYGFIIGYKFVKKIPFDAHGFYKIVFLFAQLLILTFLLGLGNNAGRYFYILIPFVILQLISELKVFEPSLTKNLQS